VIEVKQINVIAIHPISGGFSCRSFAAGIAISKTIHIFRACPKSAFATKAYYDLVKGGAAP